MDKLNRKLTEFVKAQGHRLTPEVASGVEQLAELIAAEETADVEPVLKWLAAKRAAHKNVVEEVGIKDLDKWQVHPETGNLHHDSGKFFSIIGLRVTGAKGREVVSWTQPVIKQHECGTLGILRKKINGVMHYLLYAKFEPGSIINPQLSPTLQATFSNLQLAHGGKKPLFTEYFEDNNKSKTIVSVIHVEDPSRFYLKTNRCIIVELPEEEELEVPEDFIWLTLPQIKKLLKVDHAVNALARAVLGSL